jgi:hypothetical protein
MSINLSNLSYLKFSIIIFSIMLIFIGFSFISYDHALSELTILFIFSVLLLSILLKLNTPNNLLFITYCMFLIKGFLLTYIFQYEDYLFFPDSNHYVNSVNNMMHISNLSFNTVSGVAGSLQVGYYYFAYFIFSIFKTNYSLLVANTFLLSISLILFYKIILIDFGKKIAFYSTIIGIFSSNLFLFGSFILKDSLVIFLTIVSIYLYKKNQRFIIFAFLCVILLGTVRMYAGFGLGLALLINIYINKRKNLNLGFKVVFLIVASLVSIGFTKISIINNYLELSQRYFSQYSIVDLITVIPISIIKFYLAPFPWNLISSPSVYTFLIIDSIIAILCSFMIIIFIYKFIKYRELRVKMNLYLIPLVVHAIVLGVEYGGDSTRQRMGIFFFLILTYTVGLFYKETKIK